MGNCLAREGYECLQEAGTSQKGNEGFYSRKPSCQVARSDREGSMEALGDREDLRQRTK